jgi:hypothetical protein
LTLDQANGGIIRNLTHEGIAVQAVAAVRPRQQLRVRFELRYPRLRIETRGEVLWANFSGRCGIRFLDLSPRMVRQINEWIFGNLLEGISLHSDRAESMFIQSTLAKLTSATTSPVPDAGDEAGRLIVSPTSRKVIELPGRPELVESARSNASDTAVLPRTTVQLDWLSRPLSSRGLAWTVNTLIVVAAVLLFSLVFLSVTSELPRWPLAMAAGATIFLTALYWGFFRMFGGASLGTTLARMAGSDMHDAEEARDDRFRVR